MPYRNIVFVKLKIELLSDYRFTDLLSDRQKLLYLGLILLAGQMENKIPNDASYIKRRLNLSASIEEIKSDIETIAKIFPKFLIKDNFLSFSNFEEIHNYRFKKHQGIPKQKIRNSQNKKKNKNKEKEIEKDKEEELFKEKYKDSKIYQFLINNIYFKNIKYPARLTHRLIDTYKNEELILYYLKKMDSWLLANPKKEKKNYERFILNWLRKEEEKMKAQNFIANLAHKITEKGEK
jgi:hypothetical protein